MRQTFPMPSQGDCLKFLLNKRRKIDKMEKRFISMRSAAYNLLNKRKIDKMEKRFILMRSAAYILGALT